MESGRASRQAIGTNFPIFMPECSYRSEVHVRVLLERLGDQLLRSSLSSAVRFFACWILDRDRCAYELPSDHGRFGLFLESSTRIPGSSCFNL
jgi:hypothetical protein